MSVINANDTSNNLTCMSTCTPLALNTNYLLSLLQSKSKQLVNVPYSLLTCETQSNMQNPQLPSRSEMTVMDPLKDQLILEAKKLQNFGCQNLNSHDDNETKNSVDSRVLQVDLPDVVVNKLHDHTIIEEDHLTTGLSFYWKPGDNSNNIIQLYHELTPLQVSNEELERGSSNLHVIELHVPECYDEIEISLGEGANNILNLTFKTQAPQQDSLPSSLNGQLYPAQEFLPKTSADGTGNNLTCTTTFSSSPSRSEAHLKLPSTSKTLSPCVNPFSLQVVLQSSTSTNLIKDSVSDAQFLQIEEELQKLGCRNTNSDEDGNNNIEYNVDSQTSSSSAILDDEIPQKREKLIECQCPNCSAEDDTKMIGSDGIPLHVCHIPDCRKVFTNTTCLEMHLVRHNAKKNTCLNSQGKYICHVTDCGKSFLRSDHMRRHLKSHSCINDSVYSYNETWHLKKHVVPQSDDDRNFVCAHCNKGFADKDTMKKHVEEHVYLFQKKLKNYIFQGLESSKRKTCQCSNCSVGGKKMRDTNGKLLHICYINDCKRVYCSVASLNRHLKRNHSFDHHFKRRILGKQSNCQYQNYNVYSCNLTRGPLSSPLHICRQCKKVFARSVDLNDHLKWYSTKENYFCAHCPKGYVNRSALIRHVKVHMPAKSNEVNDKQQYTGAMPNCKKVSSSARYNNKNLERHEKKNFLCAYCEKEFASKLQLCNHIRAHMPEYRNRKKSQEFKNCSTEESKQNEMANHNTPILSSTVGESLRLLQL